jgi:hypothetical protein
MCAWYVCYRRFKLKYGLLYDTNCYYGRSNVLTQNQADAESCFLINQYILPVLHIGRHFLSFFIWTLHCLPFDFRLLIVYLLSSNLAWNWDHWLWSNTTLDIRISISPQKGTCGVLRATLVTNPVNAKGNGRIVITNKRLHILKCQWLHERFLN